MLTQGYSADRTTRSGVVALRSVADRLDGRDSARKLQVEAAPRASRELGPGVGVGQGTPDAPVGGEGGDQRESGQLNSPVLTNAGAPLATNIRLCPERCGHLAGVDEPG